MDWPLITSYPWKVSWLLLLFSLGLSIFSSVLAIKAGHLLCGLLGGNVPFPRFLYIFCLSQLGRYLPGRVWNVVGFTVLMERESVSKAIAIVFPFLYQGVLVTLFFLLGVMFCGPLVITKLMPHFTGIFFLASALLFLIVFSLPMLTRWLHRFIPFNLPAGGYYTALFILLLSGIVLSVAFFLFLSSLITVSMKDALFIGGGFLLSYVFGWMVFITPGGVGVREGILGFLLSFLLPSGLSNVLALGARLWVTISEILLLAGLWFIVGLRRSE
ncbi:MAG: hypothetical protein V2A69_04260 [Pseudomonadota bacterium]